MELQGAGKSEERHLGELGREQVSLWCAAARRGGVSMGSCCRGWAGQAGGTHWLKHELRTFQLGSSC